MGLEIITGNLINKSNSVHNSVQYIYLLLFSTWSGHPCAHHQEKNYFIYATLVFVTLYGWRLGVSLQPAEQTPPIRSDKNQCRIHTVVFSWWAHGCPKHVEKWNKYTKLNCALSWIYLQNYTRMQVNKTYEKNTEWCFIGVGAGPRVSGWKVS